MPQVPSGDNHQYRHVPFLKPGTIRLLRLLPHPTQDAPLQCQLFEYPLLGPGEVETRHGSHLYEALSYVWGKLGGRHSISIDGRDLPITANLHAALRHLRNRHLERILWVDAVCINQGNDGEKADQIQLMASIYSQANRVVVWLDEAGDEAGDWALQEIRRLAAGGMDGNSTELVISEEAKRGVLALLKRRWFERIWVLQEVAAAQSIQIRCRAIGVDGYAFSTALSSAALDPVYEADPDLQSLIRPVTYLIRGATFRQGEEPVRISARPLGELIDMYHSRQATVRHDKVFALLAMSSDLLPADLSPNYGIQWHVLFERVVTFLLGTQVTVETSADTETAAISGRGVVIGKVSSTTHNRNNQQRVVVTLKDTSGRLDTEGPREWILPPLARPAQIGDLVCLLAGAARPTLIRQCSDYFSVVAIATPPLEKEQAAITDFPLRMLLVWDWEAAQPGAQRGDDYDTLMQYRAQVCSGAKILAYHPSKLDRLWNASSVLDDGEQYQEAAAALRQIIDARDMEFGESLGTLAAKERLVQVYRRSHEWGAAREILEQLVETRKCVQGARHPDTLRNMEELASTYEDEGTLVPEKLKAITDILRCGTPLGRERVVHIAGSLDAEVLRILFSHRGDEVEVAEDVTKAVAGNIWEGGASMDLLLDYRGDEVKITEDVLVAAAGNKLQGSTVLAILLQRRKAEVGITERVLAAATGNHWQGAQIKELLRGREHSESSQLGDDGVGASLEPFELRNLRRTYDYRRVGLFDLPPVAPNWEAIHGKPTLQIVAVHGLLGDPFESWTSESPTGAKTLWLNDLLLRKLPNTRVATYGYDASIVRRRRSACPGLRDDARRLLIMLRNLRECENSVHIPLVFIGHGMGGIIIRQALTIADNERLELGSIIDNTKGIVFFGTPHRGMDVAGLVSKATALSVMALRPAYTNRVLDDLRPNSYYLMNLAEDFRPIASRYAITTFVEDNITKSVGRVIVPRHSAVMELKHEEAILLDGNHFSMCKFQANDPRFEMVWRAIQKAARGPPA